MCNPTVGKGLYRLGLAQEFQRYGIRRVASEDRKEGKGDEIVLVQVDNLGKCAKANPVLADLLAEIGSFLLSFSPSLVEQCPLLFDTTKIEGGYPLLGVVLFQRVTRGGKRKVAAAAVFAPHGRFVEQARTESELARAAQVVRAAMKAFPKVFRQPFWSKREVRVLETWLGVDASGGKPGKITSHGEHPTLRELHAFVK